MNSEAIAEFVTQWVIVNVTAAVVLAVLSYFSSVLILDGLARLDRWMYARNYKRGSTDDRADAGPNGPDA